MKEVEEESMVRWQNRGGVLRERKGLQGDVVKVDSCASIVTNCVSDMMSH